MIEQLVRRCWQKAPTDRPSMDQIRVTLQAYDSSLSNAYTVAATSSSVATMLPATGSLTRFVNADTISPKAAAAAAIRATATPPAVAAVAAAAVAAAATTGHPTV